MLRRVVTGMTSCWLETLQHHFGGPDAFYEACYDATTGRRNLHSLFELETRPYIMTVYLTLLTSLANGFGLCSCVGDGRGEVGILGPSVTV